MDNGVGAAAALWSETLRFAQSAITSFVAAEYRPFVIDAGATVEYLAKFVIADRGPAHLFDPRVRKRLTDHERQILTRPGPRSGDMTMQQRARALDSLASRQSIKAEYAFKFANRILRNSADPVAAARLRYARNAGIHLGTFPPDPTPYAADLIGIVHHMTPRPQDVWGPWAGIATVDHLSTMRSPAHDAELRLAEAKARWDPSFVSNNRRSRSTVIPSPDGATYRCPVCNNGAVRATTRQVPAVCITPAERDQEVGVLDCLYCGLVLFGTQIAHAEGLRPTPSATWEQGHSEYLP